MRFRLGLVTGLATGYYLGARAGRQRYDQINRSLGKLRRSEAFEQAADVARAVVDEGLEKVTEKAKEAADQLVGDKADRADQGTGGIIITNGHGAESEAEIPTTGLILPTDPPTGLGGYSSSR